MNSRQQRHGWLIVCLSALALLTLFLLTGADYGPQVGRYRMSVITRNNFTDIFVIDTVTGVVKYLGPDEGKPFDQIKGK
jgi:hypothetical protein